MISRARDVTVDAGDPLLTIVCASSAAGSTTERSHEPWLAVTRRHPSSLATSWLGSLPTGSRLYPALGGSRFTGCHVSASTTETSPLSLLGKNANVCSAGLIGSTEPRGW